MNFIKILSSGLFHIVALLFVLVYLLGVLNLHFSDRTNHCAMTYMYEYPQFVRIHFNDHREYAQYGLYAYSEGRLTENARKMRFDGIPVLFLPGNSGSHMQARSLASVALRKALSKGYEYHFDFFTISYNEELTGLIGATLNKQVEFAAKSIHKILELYSSNKYTKYVPSSVILIGHSMGGVIASHLMAFPSTLNKTKLAITLATPLKAPTIPFDSYHNSFYKNMKEEWYYSVHGNEEYRGNKVLISFGNGPRDVLVPSGLTASNLSHISALTTAVPGVWVSPDHVCIVWCKQLVMSINKYLFSLVDPRTQQLVEDTRILKDRARQFFVANRTMTLDPASPVSNVTMIADAFWYEDNRRIYQVSRPEIDKMTYLMIRLVAFPQNRFVAIEAVNVDDKEWVFGCNAMYTYNVHRYCKQASSLSAMSRWTGAATEFGKRKLATINLHTLKQQHPDWTHVIVKVSPTRKPITLNVDINDHASRQIEVSMPSLFTFGKRRTIITETEKDSLYYELVLKDFHTLPEAYLLFVEPTTVCKEYHVSAEVHVPWAKNHEYYHYFTYSKRSPMKLRLFTTNPSVTLGAATSEHVKVTLLLDPRCSYTVSISASWYHSLAQLVRNYTPLLIPYLAAIVILAASDNIHQLYKKGECVSIHTTLASGYLNPVVVIPMAKFLLFLLTSVPFITFVTNLATYDNKELLYAVTSIAVPMFPMYMAALGILSVIMAGVLTLTAFSSQIDRWFIKIFWRGGASLAENVASALRKVPMVLSTAMVAAAPVSCGAAALAVGAVFYAFLISKMFEDYFEDYTYKLFAKIASKLCRLVKRKPRFLERNATGDEIKWRNLKQLELEGLKPAKKPYEYQEEDLSNMNFHMMMFSLWMVSTVLNLPALLAWARNFKYETQLNPDPSFDPGLVMSACSGYIWQQNGPRYHTAHERELSLFIYALGIFAIAVGPFSLAISNYTITIVFLTITVQQMFDSDAPINVEQELEKRHKNRRNDRSNQNRTCEKPNERNENQNELINDQNSTKESSNESAEKSKAENSKPSAENNKESAEKSNESAENRGNETDSAPNTDSTENCNVCDESRIYTMFKNLRDKLSFNE